MVLLCNTCLVNQQWCIIHSDRSRKVGKADLQVTCRRSCPERSDNCLSWGEVGNIYRTKWPSHIINLSVYCVQKNKEVTWSHMCMVLGQSLGNYQPDSVSTANIYCAPGQSLGNYQSDKESVNTASIYCAPPPFYIHKHHAGAVQKNQVIARLEQELAIFTEPSGQATTRCYVHIS